MAWNQDAGAVARMGIAEEGSLGQPVLRRTGMGATVLFLASAVLLMTSAASAQEAETPEAPEAETGQVEADSGAEPSPPQAEDQTDPEYQYNRGMTYIRGEDLPQDREEALRWFLMAAEQGHAEAQFSLGISYNIGLGVPQDLEEAAQWFRLAAEQDFVPAQERLDALQQ